MKPTTADLWHAAGRAARDGRKRFVALVGVLFTGPVLLLGAVVVRALTAGVDARALRHPVGYVMEPLRDAWLADHDLAVFAYLLWQGFLVVLLWGRFGGTLYRLAAVDLAAGRKEEPASAARFAARHWRGLVGARLAVLGAGLGPLVAAAALALVGRMEGALGMTLLAVVVLPVAALALLGVVIGSVAVLAGFLTGPTVACEDSDAFDAVSRAFTYAGAGLPRLVGLRLRFLLGVLLGSGWRALRTALVMGVAVFALRVGAGHGAIDRAAAILKAMGEPPDAARLGISSADYAVAGAMALAFGLLVVVWLADLISRVVCARTAVYLILRRDVDGVPTDRVRTQPEFAGPQAAEGAGFVEVARVGEPGS